MCPFSTSQLPKVLQAWCVLYILTSKMCFAPQRRALFQHLNFEKCSQADVVLCILSATCASRHNGLFFFNISTYLNFQKCSRNGVFCTFSLPNVFRATTACNFAIFHLSSSQMLRARRFSEPSFRPSGATNHWKNAVSRDFLPFLRTCIFFLLTLSLL